MSLSYRSLIQLSQRVSTAVRSGIDARRIWELEERNASGPLRPALAAVRQHVGAGGTVAEALHAQGGLFPPLFVQMVAVGEQTGKLDEVLERLAEHYQHLAAMRRMFWTGVAWPLFELVVAVLVIGGVMIITGIIGSVAGGQPLDLLGLGLTGTSGAITWFTACGAIAGGIALAAHALFQGWFGPGPVLAAMRVPVLGKCLESLALSRLTWSLAVALDSGMDARRAVALSIRAAQNPYYESSLPRVTAAIRANRQFHESFAEAGVFPDEFLQQLEAAELAGATTESLLRLAREYDERAETALKILTGIATVLVTLVVFGVIILAIFSIAYHAYFKPLYDALEMTNSGL